MKEDVDISVMSHDGWLKFVFDHPVSEKVLEARDWYWEFDYEVSDPRRLVEHVTGLCNEFATVAEKYSLPQLDQGIWFIIGPCIDFGRYLRNKQVPIEARKSCVRAMYWVFANFVSKSKVEEMETCFWMWWDILLDAFYINGDTTGHFDEDAQNIEDGILETLSSILQLEDVRTQQYALHGLGHLKHEKAREIVSQYIDAHGREWNEEGRKWLETCRDGTVM